ncbi:MAG: TraB/GumN family protein [Flavipsychrobacter sp.]|nr:TraB/GumN family protein [Flavipsychrobacter sp.]
MLSFAQQKSLPKSSPKAQNKTQTRSQKKVITNDKSLLWRVKGKGLVKPSYLFGTIHRICPEDFLWTIKMEENFQKSEKVCFEMDLDDTTVMTEITTGLMSNNGKKLSETLTQEQYNIFEKFIQDSLGLEMSFFDQIKPAAIPGMIIISAGGCEHPISYENRLTSFAKTSNKEILGLETPKEQLELLDQIPIDSVISQLMYTIQNNTEDTVDFKEMMKAYKDQDLPKLSKMMSSIEEPGIDMNAFLVNRNKKWIPRMTNKMNANSIFFAVGAGHLYGKNGVISLLRKDGYTVEPLK